jgi:predicted alpha-1,2-mannosidase
MRYLHILTIIVFGFLLSCSSDKPDFTKWVNPFIGTGGHGHTFPGVSLPYGMVQLSPDTRTLGWDACGGYYQSDNSILGFSHTHLSGTGIGDYGDILFTPYSGNIAFNDTAKLNDYYPSFFNKNSEKANPGYYKVVLCDPDTIIAELTGTTRTGFHRYNFQPGKSAKIIVDLKHAIYEQKILQSELKIINDHELCGMRLTEGWAKRQYVYFHAKFSKPFKAKLFANNQVQNVSQLSGNHLKVLLDFGQSNTNEVLAKVGISAVDYEGARKNLETEIADFDFDKTRLSAQKSWNKHLAKIEVEGGTDDQKTIFYTAMYHAALQPNIYMDADKRYRGQDLKIHTASDFTNYTVFSLWDTFRAYHPYLTILEPKRDAEMIRCLLKKYEQGGFLPKWDLAANYTGTMIGDHSISIITDAWFKGIKDFDAQLALKAMLRTTVYDTTGIIVHHPAIWEWLIPKSKLYNDSLGFVPCDKEVFATSKALETAYNEWCIAKYAGNLKNLQVQQKFDARAERYKTYFDPVTGFMRGKTSDGKWQEPFNPYYSDHANSPYIEGNAWQWLWFVPQDVNGLVNLMGGKEAFVTKLDSLFSVTSKVQGENASADISGLIGQYAHGNEPSHHIAYLYNYIGQPWKTQEKVDQILQTMYKNSPDGLSGNEDCGQMSAWYLLSSIGFYQVCPGNPVYTIGRPLFDQVTIHLENGKKLTITALNNSGDNKYVKSLTVNGITRQSPFFEHSEIINGGEIIFEMDKNH